MLPTNVQVKYLRQDKNQKGIYEIRIYLGRHNGKSKRKTKNIRATSKRAAIKIAETMIRDGELSITAPGRISHEITFQKFIEIWKNRHFIRLAPRTRIVYQGIIDIYLMDMFGHRKLDSITTNDVRYFLQNLYNLPNPRTRSGKLSPTMIHKCYRLLSQILHKAEEGKYITQNPCKGLSQEEIPRPDYHHAPIWQKKELAIFIQHLEEIPDTYHNFQKKVMLYLFLMTGMRKGELSVLHWSDINMQNKSILVSKALKLMSSQEITIAAPKTKQSQRELFIDDFNLRMLEELWKRQQDYLMEIGKSNTADFIFITQRRKSREIIPVSPSYLYMWITREAKACGLPHIDVHSLRHMAATYALAGGAPLIGVQNMLGHTRVGTTANYLHLMEQQKQETTNALSDVLAALRKSDSNNSSK